MRLQLSFQVVASPNEPKSNVIAITSTKSEDGKTFTLQEEVRYASAHKELQKESAYSRLKANLKRRGDRISIWFILTDDLEKIYIDEAMNLRFEDIFLKEIDDSKPSDRGKLERFSERGKQGRGLEHITEKLIGERFNSRTSNADQWITKYERECRRWQIDEDEQKIETLRLFLDDTGQEWYSSLMLREEE
ncbi:hypothetical protein M0804_014355 [Polistes exclamans]|nr:hypothetical protein M0804_014355 [Polistes exclamans]